MLQSYRDVLARPGGLAFSAAGVLARLPISTVGIGLVLAVSARYGSYALAGRVAAVQVLSQSVVAPVLARLVDRRGQAAVMGPSLTAAVLGLGLLAWTAAVRGPEPLLYAGALVVGATMGSVGSLVRARWSHLLSDPRELHTAYSLESVLDEVVFMVGPVLATALATGVTPVGGLLLAALAAGVGGWLLLAQRSTEPPPVAHDPAAGRSRLMSGPLVAMVVAFVAMGSVFGAVDVSVVAFTEGLGHKPWAGAVLAVFALGSGVGGFVYGSRHWASPPRRHFVLGLVVLGLGVGLFGRVSTIPVLAAVALLVGLAIAPSLVAGNALVTAITPAGRLTEALTWIGTSLGVGVSVGAWAGGAMVDRAGSSGGFTVVLGSGVAAALAAVGSAPALRRATAHSPLAPNAAPST